MRRSGYTLLELSVVISVIGIVAGGIFVAQSLVRSSYLNRVLSEYDSYVKAYAEFHEKFLAYPGDMNNAVAMWGLDPNGCVWPNSNNVPKIPTCNGNGDGKIGDSSTAGALSNSLEWFRAWQHLGNAGFIDNKFTGVPGSGGVAEARPPFNVPETAEAEAGWTLYFLQLTANGNLWADQYGHVMNLGKFTPGNSTIGPFLTPSEARAVDAKVDDARPGRGFIRAWRTGVLPSCTISDTTQDLQAYNTAGTAKVCSLLFIMGY